MTTENKFLSSRLRKAACEISDIAYSLCYQDNCSDHIPFRELYRHKKNGDIYDVICNATLSNDDILMIVYRNTKTGERWVRPATEFGDGRFEMIE